MRTWAVDAYLSVVIALSLGTAACEKSAPASTDGMARRGARGIEWTGSRGEPPAQPRPKASMRVPANTWVLHIGDSFVHASLQQKLGPLVRATGSNYVVQATTATYTTTWSADPQLDRWLARRPSLVLVTLGANEVEMPTPSEHAGAIAHLAKKIADAGASCVWITPPMWKTDTGILQVIHDHSAPCLFFDSDAVTGGLAPEERQHDHIHPNERGGARWTSALWQWLGDHRDPERPAWGLLPYEHRGV